MAVFTVVLYIIAIICITIAALCLSLMLIPLRYRFDGGYEDSFYTHFSLSFAPLIGIRGDWDSKQEKPLQLKLVIAGLSIFFNPEKWDKKEKKKEKTPGKNVSFFAFMRCLERDLIGSVRMLLGDLLGMLKPKKLEIKGKLGFAEPHLNGWLVAIICMLEQWNEIKLNIEPVWEEEHYEVAVKVEGRLVLCAMIFRMARFILTRRTLKFFNQLRKEKKASFAA